MAAGQGFLLIDLMMALFLFMGFAYSVVRLEASIVAMHNQISARTEVMRTLRNVIEGKGADTRRVRGRCSVECAPYQKSPDKNLPLNAVCIREHKEMMGQALEMAVWIYE